jgi:hypothetical protein
MDGRLRVRVILVLVGALAAVVVTWGVPVWFLQPSLPATVGSITDAQAAAWPAFCRAETTYCFTLNAVWCTAAVWLVAGGATMVRARVPARPSRWRRT